MDASALANAESWLWWISIGKLFAAGFVAIGVVLEFGGDWVARPYEEIVSAAHEQQETALKNDTLRLTAELDDAKAKLEQARAQAAQNDANLLTEQRLTARERMRLERLERAVLPRAQFVNWNELITALTEGHFQPVNVAIVGGAEADDFGHALAQALTEAGIMGDMIPAPTDPTVISRLGHNSSGLQVLRANADGSRLAEMLWTRFQIGGGELSIALAPREWTDLPRNTNCLLVQDNGWAMSPGRGQPGEGLDEHHRPVPEPQ